MGKTQLNNDSPSSFIAGHSMSWQEAKRHWINANKNNGEQGRGGFAAFNGSYRRSKGVKRKGCGKIDKQ